MPTSQGPPLAAGRRPETRYPSPLRYPGGKGKLANFLKLVMLENRLVGSEYVEVYAGGASVALSLLFEQYASHIHINDLNPSISTFWKVALERPDELCRRIAKTTVSVEEWRRQRDVQLATEPDDLELAFSTFFLNRTSRSGIISGGIIGGLDQSGPWKIDARFDRTDLIRRIEKIGRFASRITVTRLDAASYLETQLPTIGSAFAYLDPPYYVKGAGLYQHFYRHADHAQIASLVRRLNAPWIVSYDAAPEIAELYKRHRSMAYGLAYSAKDRYEGDELMFFSEGLVVPEVDTPANLPRREIEHARRKRAVRLATPTAAAK